MQSGDQNGLDGSYIDCYMNEHQYISVEEAQRHVANMISSYGASILNKRLIHFEM
jgi:hypothetical protein